METKRSSETSIITNKHGITSKKTEIITYNAVKTLQTESVVKSIDDDDHTQ
jgi:hypothetical protein